VAAVLGWWVFFHGTLARAALLSFDGVIDGLWVYDERKTKNWGDVDGDDENRGILESDLCGGIVSSYMRTCEISRWTCGYIADIVVATEGKRHT
jgi:hypothetical protein